MLLIKKPFDCAQGDNGK